MRLERAVRMILCPRDRPVLARRGGAFGTWSACQRITNMAREVATIPWDSFALLAAGFIVKLTMSRATHHGAHPVRSCVCAQE